jgi:hypothetical protein
MTWIMTSMIEKPIDVWNIRTFDNDLLAELRSNAELIRDYMVTEKRNLLERQASDRMGPCPSNPYAGTYLQLVEDIGRGMEIRTIRAWHYTRLTDADVNIILRTGVNTSTLETIRRRLDAQVAASVFSAKTADALFAGSPFHHKEQSGARINKFWMTSHPLGSDDGGVMPLLGSWGGEAIYFWLQDATLKKLVAGIGKPRVLELAVPLDATRHAYSAGQAVVATFGQTLGREPNMEAFDLYATRALGPEAVIAIHTEGQPDFGALAREYPAGFRKS